MPSQERAKSIKPNSTHTQNNPPKKKKTKFSLKKPRTFKLISHHNQNPHHKNSIKAKSTKTDRRS